MKDINEVDKKYKSDLGIDIHYDRYLLWRNIQFSDIMNFDPNNYIYFTHSVRMRKKGHESLDFVVKDAAYSPEADNFDIFSNPMDLRKKERISVSLSTSSDHYTYGRIGYIVAAPIENILCVGQAPFDKSNDELRRRPLKTPADAHADMFREVVLEGSTMYGNVRPIAIFVNLTGANESEVVQIMYELEEMKKATFNLFPVIDLSDKNYQLKNASNKTL